MDKIEILYGEAERCYTKNHQLAKPLYEKVVEAIGHRPIDEMDDVELRYFALSKMHIFLSSEFQDTDSSEKAIDAFELLRNRNSFDIKICGAYILVLELSYRYEKSHELLESLLNEESTVALALKSLSSYTYCAEGLQSSADCIAYKKRLIDMTSDKKEKNRLQKELEAMQ